MIQVAAIGIMTAILAIAMPKEKKEFSILIVLAGCFLILCLSYQRIDSVIKIIRQVQKALGKGNGIYVVILLKIVGITYIAEFSSEICKDAGYGALSNQIDFYGKILILAVSMPILQALLETIGNYLK